MQLARHLKRIGVLILLCGLHSQLLHARAFQMPVRGIIKGTVVPSDASSPTSSVRFIYNVKPGQDKGDMCSGTFISETLFLTAQHCVEGFPKTEVILGWSASDQSPKGIKALAVHSYGDSQRGKDLAVVQFPNGTHQGPVFRLSFAAPESDDKLMIFGFGRDQKKGPTKPALRTGVCDTVVRNEADFTTTRSLGNAYTGDSGGPLLLIDKMTGAGAIVGVISGITTGGLFSPIAYENNRHTRIFDESSSRRLRNDPKIQFFLKLIKAGLDLPTVKCSCKRKFWRKDSAVQEERVENLSMVDAETSGQLCRYLETGFDGAPDFDAATATYSIYEDCR